MCVRTGTEKKKKNLRETALCMLSTETGTVSQSLINLPASSLDSEDLPKVILHPLVFNLLLFPLLMGSRGGGCSMSDALALKGECAEGLKRFTMLTDGSDA